MRISQSGEKRHTGRHGDVTKRFFVGDGRHASCAAEPRPVAQVFGPVANTIARFSLVGGLFGLGLLFGALELYVRSPYVTSVGQPIEQPVPFSHKHHVTDDGIDCRYCHTTVENSAFAGMPSTQTCMNCHSEIWAQSPTLEPVRQSFLSGVP